jgi:hypothetical protein
MHLIRWAASFTAQQMSASQPESPCAGTPVVAKPEPKVASLFRWAYTAIVCICSCGSPSSAHRIVTTSLSPPPATISGHS